MSAEHPVHIAHHGQPSYVPPRAEHRGRWGGARARCSPVSGRRPGGQPRRSRCEAGRHPPLRGPQRARALRRPSIGDGGQHRAAEPDVRHAAAAPPQGRADDHSRSRLEVGDLAGRQEVHLPPPQGREVPRRRRFHGRGRQGDLRPHRPAAQGRGHPAHAAVRHGGRDRRGRPAQDRVPAHRGAAQGLHAGRLRQRLEHHRAEEDARREPGQPAPGDELSGHRALPSRLPEGQGSLDHGEESELLEQGAALRRPARGLSHVPVLAGAGLVLPGRQGRLRAAARSGLLAQGQGDAGRHRGRLQPVGHPGLLDEHGEEQGPGQSQGASGHPPGHGPPHAGRGRQGHGAHAGRRLRLSVPRDVDAARRAGEEARLSDGRQAGRARGAEADEGSRLRQRPQEPRLRRARYRDLQAVGGRHPGHAQGAHQRRDEPPGRADVGVVRRGPGRQLRPGHQRDRLHA